MSKLFAFAGAASVPATDPRLAMNPTMLLKNFSGVPWPGTSSGGTSGSHNFDSGSASAGGAFGTHGSALLDGATNYIEDSTDALGSIVSAGAFALEFIGSFSSLAASDANPDNEPAIFSDASGYIRLTVSASGIRLAIYGSTPTAYVPITTGVKYDIQCELNAGTARVRVNGGAWTPVASGNIMSVSPAHPIIGSNYSLAHKVAGSLALAFGRDSAFTGTEANDLYADAQANYGVP